MRHLYEQAVLRRARDGGCCYVQCRVTQDTQEYYVVFRIGEEHLVLTCGPMTAEASHADNDSDCQAMMASVAEAFDRPGSIDCEVTTIQDTESADDEAYLIRVNWGQFWFRKLHDPSCPDPVCAYLALSDAEAAMQRIGSLLPGEPSADESPTGTQ